MNNKMVSIYINSYLLNEFIRRNKLFAISNRRAIEYLFENVSFDDEDLNKYLKINIGKNDIIKNIEVKFSIDKGIYKPIKKYSIINNTTLSNIINKAILFNLLEVHNTKIDLNKIKKQNTINYPKEILNYKLKNEIKIKIQDMCKNETVVQPRFIKSYSDKVDLYENIYKMRYIFNYSPQEIHSCFLNKVSLRAVEQWLKSTGWSFDKFEAQKRASKKRNYKSIKNKGKNTIMKNYYTPNNKGTESYVRMKTNLFLHSLFNCNEYNVIVGLNTYVSNTGKEIDIPIIIINKDKIYKYGIEVNGDIWHNKEKDDIKRKQILEKGYILFYVFKSGNTKTQKEEYGEIDNQIKTICSKIYNLAK